MHQKQKQNSIRDSRGGFPPPIGFKLAKTGARFKYPAPRWGIQPNAPRWGGGGADSAPPA